MIFPKLHIEWERWKWNKEHQMYVSTLGNFKTKDKRPVKTYTNGTGYLAVKSRNSDKKLLNAHRLVMMTWKPIGNAEEMTIDHLDHNKRNNRLSNLEWVTKEENTRRAKEDLFKSDKATKVKFIPTAYTLEHFYLCCNGLYFTESNEVLTYMRTQNPCVSIHHKTGIEKAFQTLVNAYNNQNPEHVAKGFIKKVHGCELSIVKKGA